MIGSNDPPEPHVVVRVTGALGEVTVNRPRAINALTIEMVRQISRALDAFVDDPRIVTILLQGAGERGMCAGGDVRELYQRIASGRPEHAEEFFRAEYALNARIAESPIPIVAFADGITMGGGIGLAGHAAVRVVTERSALAMPETRIGFTPDVGGSLLLARAPGRLGEYLALTGDRMDAADAICCGFADVRVPSARLEAVRDALRAGVAAQDACAQFAEAAPGPARLDEARAWIDPAFSADTVADIIDRLRVGAGERSSGSSAQASVIETLTSLSPTALVVTLAAVRRARALPNLRAALAQEYGLVSWFVRTQPDLVEGIRAQVVDKDRAPTFRPATLAGLDPGVVPAAFAHPPETPWRG